MTGQAVTRPITRQAGCVAIGGKGILIEGAPGTGKSSLALALVDRGAQFIADDGVLLDAANGGVIARPHPRTQSLIEVRNLGLLTIPCGGSARIALVITLDPLAPRYPNHGESLTFASVALPHVRIWPQEQPPAIKAELALRHFGLQF
mgnify:CR=1 FL=1